MLRKSSTSSQTDAPSSKKTVKVVPTLLSIQVVQASRPISQCELVKQCDGLSNAARLIEAYELRHGVLGK